MEVLFEKEKEKYPIFSPTIELIKFYRGDRKCKDYSKFKCLSKKKFHKKFPNDLTLPFHFLTIVGSNGVEKVFREIGFPDEEKNTIETPKKPVVMNSREQEFLLSPVLFKNKGLEKVFEKNSKKGRRKFAYSSLNARIQILETHTIFFLTISYSENGKNFGEKISRKVNPWDVDHQMYILISYLLSDLFVYSSYCGLDKNEKLEFACQFNSLLPGDEQINPFDLNTVREFNNTNQDYSIFSYNTYKKKKARKSSHAPRDFLQSKLQNYFFRINSIGKSKPNFLWIIHDVIKDNKMKLSDLFNYQIRNFFKSKQIVILNTFEECPKEKRGTSLSFKTSHFQAEGRSMEFNALFVILGEICFNFNKMNKNHSVVTLGLDKIFREYYERMRGKLENIAVGIYRKKMSEYFSTKKFPFSAKSLLKLHNDIIDFIKYQKKYRRVLSVFNITERYLIEKDLFHKIIGGKEDFKKIYLKQNEGDKGGRGSEKKHSCFSDFVFVNRNKSVQVCNEFLVKMYFKFVKDVREYDNVNQFKVDLEKFKKKFLEKKNLGTMRINILGKFLKDEEFIIGKIEKNILCMKANVFIK